MKFPKTLQALTFAGIGGIAIAAATATAASAAYTYTQCDRDGDRCWRVRCDNDGDFCRRTGFVYSGYGHRYYQRPYRHWVCDRDGDDCHWAYDRYNQPYVGFGLRW